MLSQARTDDTQHDSAGALKEAAGEPDARSISATNISELSLSGACRYAPSEHDWDEDKITLYERYGR